MLKKQFFFHRFLRYLLDLPRKALYIALGIVCAVSFTTIFAVLPSPKNASDLIFAADWNAVVAEITTVTNYFDPLSSVLKIANNNVGIGTTADFNAKLKVNGDILLSGGDRKISTDSSGALTLRTDTIDRLKITSGGNVGIGTISPAEKLDVAGNIKTSGYLNLSDMTAPSTPTNKLYSVSSTIDETNVSGILQWGTQELFIGTPDLISNVDVCDSGTTSLNSPPTSFDNSRFVVIGGYQTGSTLWDFKMVPYTFFNEINAVDNARPQIGLHMTFETSGDSRWWHRSVQYSTLNTFNTTGIAHDAYCVNRIWKVN